MLFSSIKKAFKILKLLKAAPIARLEHIFPLLHFEQIKHKTKMNY